MFIPELTADDFCYGELHCGEKHRLMGWKQIVAKLSDDPIAFEAPL